MNNFCSTCGKPIRHHDNSQHHSHSGTLPDQHSHGGTLPDHRMDAFHGHHQDQHNHHSHSSTFNHHQPHFHKDDCMCERFFCDDRFKVRLGGLTSGLNFRLRQLIGCEVKMKVECGNDCEEILAEICFVGNDFVEVHVLQNLGKAELEDDPAEDAEEEKEKKKKKKKKKDKHEKFAIFPMESVKWFELEEDEDDDCDCDCDDHNDCDCCK